MFRALRIIAPVLLVLVGAPNVVAQTTYHLHTEASTTAGLNQLKTAGPDAASVAIQTANLKSTSNGEKLIKAFDTQAGVPGVAGVIPSGSTLTVQLWMRKTASVGTLFPRAKVFLNSSAGTSLCTATGATAITTTLTKYTITCNTSANVTLLASSRFYVWAGANMTAGSTTTNFMAELDIEGTLNGNFDSQIAIPNPIPPPTITAPLVPSAAGIGQSVTINGTNFGATQGTSTVKFFNNKTATATNWSPTSITATVPSGTTTGNVTVTVATQVSNGVGFTVLPTPTISTLSPASGNAGTLVTINGSNFGGSQGASTVTFNGVAATSFTSWTATQVKATAPAGTTTGPVIVTVGGVPSAANKIFTVPPVLTSLTPTVAHISESVTIAGTNFLATQGTSTVKFNGTTASPTNWSNTSITVPVPAGSTSGNVVVAINSVASNGLPFTVIPPPVLSSAAPSSTIVGEAVSVTGTTFGATQGTSTIKFNGTTATASLWSDTRIIATVPAGATTGNIVVTVANQPSNGLAFTVSSAGTIGGSVTRVTGGTGISGATVQALLAGVIKGSATTAGNGSYSIASLPPGTYTVRAFATGFSSELLTGQSVIAGVTATINIAMYVPGSVAGRVTQSDGTTPISGAAVSVYSGSTQSGVASTNGAGDYTIAALHPGSYTAQAGSAGYQTSQQAATVAENATTTKNFSLNGAPAGPVQYLYDAAGRLIQVTDQTGDTAIYRYDAVGNITAIERPTSGAVSISGFAPASGLVGASVMIAGTGFSATPAQNTVTFNGVTASVTSAMPTQIVATVPAAATSGSIAVATPGGSATSAQAFTVLAPSLGPPTVTGFSPAIATPGTGVTINGTNFDALPANNRPLLNLAVMGVSVATSTALTTAVPANAGSGPISVATPSGTAASTADLFVPPSPFTAADVQFTDRASIGGGSKVVTIGTANRIGLVTFSASAGQHVSAILTGSTIPGGTATLLSPYNVALATTFIGTGLDGFLDTVAFDTGTFTVLVDPNVTYTGAVTLSVSTVVPDVTGTISIGGPPVVVTTTAAGQNARLTFTGTAGQRIGLMPSNSGFGGVAITVRNPDNSALATSGIFLDAVLPAAGTYTIFFDPFGADIGSITFTLSEVPPDVTGTISFGGPPVTFSAAAPGQNAILTFTGTAGHRVSLAGPTNSYPTLMVSLKNPDNMTFFWPTPIPSPPFIEPVTLPSTGTYTLVLDPYLDSTGTITVTLYDVPADDAASVTMGGPAATVSMTTPGQNGVVSFPGTSGQQVTVHYTNSTVPGMALILKCGGFHVRTTSGGPGSFDWSPTTIPFTSTCTVTVDPINANLGSVTVGVTSP